MMMPSLLPFLLAAAHWLTSPAGLASLVAVVCLLAALVLLAVLIRGHERRALEERCAEAERQAAHAAAMYDELLGAYWAARREVERLRREGRGEWWKRGEKPPWEVMDDG